jgi:hypothetical protein
LVFSITKLLGNKAGTSAEFTAHHLRAKPSSKPPRQAEFGTSAPSTQAAEPSLGTVGVMGLAHFILINAIKEFKAHY